MYRRDALRKLVRSYADPQVGAVCGELRYSDGSDNGVGSGIGLYKRYQILLKKMESSINSTIGAYGSIYAIKKDLYTPLPAEIVSDFVEPLMIIKKGYRNIYEGEAISVETPERDYAQEFKRRVRIITRGLNGFFYARELLKADFTGFALFNSKFLRWLTPVLMLLFLVSNFFNLNGIYLYFLVFQILFYLMALAGLKFKNRLFYIPSYFVMINYASLIALVEFLRGERYVSWDTSKR